MCESNVSRDAQDLIRFPLRLDEVIYKGIRVDKRFATAGDYLDKPVFDSDVFICTYPKSGTTWTQEIVYLILNQDDMSKSDAAPINQRMLFLEGIPNPSIQYYEPRIIKTHLPCDLLPKQLWEKPAKVIHVVRNPRDAAVSFYHHGRSRSGEARFTGTWSEFYERFISGNGRYGCWFNYIKQWQHYGNRKDVITIYYEDMLQNIDKVIIDLARFLDKPISGSSLVKIKKRVSFVAMKNNSMTNMSSDPFFDQSVTNFIRKGVAGDWKNLFTVSQMERFDQLYKTEMDKAKSDEILKRYI